MKKHLPLLLVLVVSTILALANFKSATTLSGWDTLHPEFNFSLYLKRIFFSLWQEHQGLGAVASQSHAAEIPRMFILLPLYLLLPASLVRYSYFFLTLILGPAGMYLFLSRVVFHKKQSNLTNLASSVAALIYLLNLGTLSHYYVPLEMFATHFATLPWLMYTASKYAREGKQKYLWQTVLVTLLAAPIAHTATLFYAFFISFCLYLAVLLYLEGKSILKRIILLIATTLTLNSFWLLPNIYYVSKYGKDVANSKIHLQFSEKAFLTGRKYGTLPDTALLRNFLFDWGEYSESKGEFVDLFDEWKPHLADPFNYLVGFAVFGLVLLGLIISFTEKNSTGRALLPVLALSFFMIANKNPFFNLLLPSLKNNFPILAESLRFPFTKFSIVLMFTYASLSAIGIDFLNQLLKKLDRKLIILNSIFLTGALTYYMLPAFLGNLISPTMKVTIPRDYFAMFDWFNDQEDIGRIAHFPVHSFWGWVYYQWQYEGAGFLWFGLKQPLLDREFDRWMPENEQFYWEISYAVYSKNTYLLKAVLNKYQVQYILFDKNVVSPQSAKALFQQQLNEMLIEIDVLRHEKSFGLLDIYKVSLSPLSKTMVFTLNNPPSVSPAYKWNNYDPAFPAFGHYINSAPLDSPATKHIYYPFRSLFTRDSISGTEFTLEENDREYLFKTQVPPSAVGAKLVTAPLEEVEISNLDPTNQYVELKYPQVYLDGELIQLSDLKLGNEIPLNYIKEGNLEVRIPKIRGEFTFDSLSSNYFPYNLPSPCEETETNAGKSQWNEAGFLKMYDKNSSHCLSIELPNFLHASGYLLSVLSKNVSGRSLFFAVHNETTDRTDFETYLKANSGLSNNYFILPPLSKDGIGYSLFLENNSIADTPAENDLARIAVQPIPYQFLSSLRIETEAQAQNSSPVTVTYVNHPNPTFYTVGLSSPNDYELSANNYLVLSQSFDSGWKAYEVSNWLEKAAPFLFGKQLKNHVLVNNWSNGWFLNNLTMKQSNNLPAGRQGETIVLIYLPQYLEYLGFGLVLSTMILIYKNRQKLP